MSNRKHLTVWYVVVALLVLVMVAALFAGCNGKPTQDPDTNKDPGTIDVVNFTVTFMVDGAVYQTATYKSTDTVTLPDAPTKEGYTFAGWYLDEATTAAFAAGKLTADVTVYAKWMENASTENPDNPDNPEDPGATPSSLDITVTGFTVEDGVFSCALANAVDSVDFAAILSVDEGSTYVISTDEAGTDVLTGAIALAEGDNTLYITVKSTDNSTRTYTVQVYRRHLYVLSFVTGTEETVANVSVEEGKTAAAPAFSGVKAGYNFVGWGYDFTQPVTASATLTAQWTAKTSTVTFEGAEGTITATYGEAMPALTFAVPTRTGYTFDGYAIAGVNYYDADLAALRDTWDVEAAEVAVTAKWLAKTYTVQFEKDVHEPVTATFGEDMPEISYEYYKAGHRFGGLAYNGTKYYNDDFTSAHVWDVDEDDVVLAEIWIAGGFNVPLMNQDQYMGTVTLTYGENFAVEVPTRTGYNFDYWYAMVGETPVEMTDAEGNSLAPSAIKDNSWTFYAHWSPVSVKIIFDPAGGKLAGGLDTDTAWVDYEQSFYVTVATKTGSTFLGWYVGDVAYTNATGASVKNWDLLTETTLIAHWSEIEYTVTFDMQGGLPQQSALTATYYGAWPTVTEVPAKTGYTFDGYYTEGDAAIYSVIAGNLTCVSNQYYLSDDVTLYAHWTPVQVYAFFNHNGGSSDMASKLVTYDASMGTLATENLPKLEGYVFAGYFSAAEGGVKYYNADGTSARNCDFVVDTTLYAQWRNGIYFVSFARNDETAFGLMPNQEIECNVDAVLDSVSYGKTGYAFAKWTTNADGTGDEYVDGAEVKDLAANGESVTLYAQWTPNQYTVTFDANGASGTMAGVTATYDAAMPAVVVAFAKTGYAFDGFYYGDEKFYNADGSSARTYHYAEDVELLAHWTAKSWTLHFDPNDEDAVLDGTVTATYDAALPTFATIPLRTGYTFVGWYLMSESGTQYYNTSGQGLQVWDYDAEGDAVTLYAHWTPNTYTVCFDSNGGENVMTTVTATFGADLPDADITFVKTGYTITGLWDAKEGGTKYYGADGTSAHVWDKDQNYVSLYAQWSVNTYTIVFDANGGTGEQATAYVNYNEVPATLDVTISRTYYRFLGYYDQRDGGTAWYTADGVGQYRWTKTSEPTTLYAHWANGRYSIVYHYNYGSDQTTSSAYDCNSSYYLNYDVSRGGYSFKEWNTAADGTGTGYNAAAVINNLGDNGETVHLYAIFTANEYYVSVRTYYHEWDVSFDLNYEDPAVEAPATQHVTPATGLRYVLPPEREGYVFAGWYKEPACENKFIFSDSVSKDTTVYAKWEEVSTPLVMLEDGTYDITVTADNQYFSFYCYNSGTVYFTVGKGAFVHVGSDHYGPTFNQYCYANTLYECYYRKGGEGEEYLGDTTITIERYWPSDDGRSTIYNYSDYFTFDDPVPLGVVTAEGYTFMGWYGGANGAGTQYVDAEGNAVNTWDKNWGYDNIYAYWIPDVYTLTLDQNGGEGGLDSIQVNFGSYPTVPEEELPTLVDYDFTGYYDAADGGVSYINAQGYGNKFWTILGDGTLYAHWKKATYRVKYDGNGADDGTMSDSIFSRNTTNTLNFYNFVKAGYTCTGWNTKADGSGDGYARNAYVENLAEAHGEITLYAQWTPNIYTVTPVTNKTASHTVTFDLNGYDGETPEPQVVTVAAGLRLPYVARDGYELIGWYDNAACTGVPYAANVEQTEDVTLYAKWRAATYAGAEELVVLGSVKEITFTGTEDKNNLATGVWFAFIAPSDMKVLFYTESSIDTYGKLCNSEKAQITYNDDDGEGNNFCINYLLTGGNLYYVVVFPFRTSTSTVVLHVAAAEGAKHPIHELDPVNVTYDAAFVMPIPELVGHEFLGWYDDLGGTGTQYTGADGVSLCNWDKTANAQLYAYWQVGTFEVTFDAAGGTGTQVAVQATYGDAMPAISVGVSRENYTFLGYFDAAEGGTKYYNADGTSAKAWDKSAGTLYAHWQGLPYTVAFDANGGTGSMSDQTMYYATEQTLSAATFTRTGYDFAGWATTAEGSKVYDDEEAVTDVADVGDTITLYAKWTAKEYEITLVKRNSYTVSFDCGGYCEDPADQVVTSSVGLTYPVPNVAKDAGRVFVGWKKNYYTYDFTAEITEDITLTAAWDTTNYAVVMPFAVNEITIPFGSPKYYSFGAPVTGYYTITLGKPSHVGEAGNVYTQVYRVYVYGGYKHNFFVQAQYDDDEYKGDTTMTITCEAVLPGGGVITPATVESTTTVTYGADTIIAAHASAGYTFMGYFDEADGAGTKYVNADGTSAKAWDKTADDAVLYAYYVANTYTVNLNLNGGSGSVTGVTATHNSAMPTISESLPTRSGYDFLGFFSAADGGVMYYDAEGNSARVYGLTAATTLYAHWDRYPFYVAFDANGGSGEMDTQRIVMDVATELADYDFSRDGYTFVGWNTQADGSGTDYSNQQSVTNIAGAKEVITLYAQWSAKVYHVYRVYNVQSTFTVTFDVNGAECETPEAQTVGVEHGLRLPQPVWAGHELIGWFDNAECTGDPVSISTAYLTDMVLYAKWRTAEYSGEDQLLTVGGSYDLTLDTTVYRAEPGYWFAFVAPSNMRVKIYSTKVEGSVDTMAWLFPAASKTVGDHLTSDDDGNGDGQFAIYYNVTAGTLYYIGVGNYYGYAGVCSICIDAVEGSAWRETMESMNVTYDADFDLDTPPAKAGYTFKGWYDGIGGTGTQLTDAAGLSLNDWNFTEDVTVYAKWEED